MKKVFLLLITVLMIQVSQAQISYLNKETKRLVVLEESHISIYSTNDLSKKIDRIDLSELEVIQVDKSVLKEISEKKRITKVYSPELLKKGAHDLVWRFPLKIKWEEQKEELTPVLGKYHLTKETIQKEKDMWYLTVYVIVIVLLIIFLIFGVKKGGIKTNSLYGLLVMVLAFLVGVVFGDFNNSLYEGMVMTGIATMLFAGAAYVIKSILDLFKPKKKE